MDTQNIKITNQGWQDLITLGELELTSGDTYTITPLGAGIYEIAQADNTPEENLQGHPVQAGTNFNFVYNDKKIWIKGYYPATVIIS